MRKYYYVEMTDTYGGEANYCWVNRFKISASSMVGAMRKVSRYVGTQKRIHCVMDCGDMRRYDVRRAAVCFFIEWFD